MKTRTKLLLLLVPTTVVLAVSAGLLAMVPEPGPDRIAVSDRVIGVRAGYSYAYIVTDGEHTVLVDVGSDTEAGALRTELGKLGIDVSRVEALLITHAHGDHWAGAEVFRHAPAYVGTADHLMLRGDRLPKAILPKLGMRLGERPPVHPQIRNVAPGSVLQFGSLRFEVIGTPGHTPGSVMYRLDDVLFTGDSLMVEGDEVDLPPPLLSDRVADNERSLSRLQNIEFSIIADGHHGIARDGRQRYARWAGTLSPPLSP